MRSSSVVLSVASAVLIFCGISKAEEVPAKPNIIMVLIDDLGWGDFSCFGNKEANTPNIDRMASEGIRFEQFYVNSSICSPSRCALTTGQYPQQWKITSFLSNRRDNERRGMAQWLDPMAPTLARILQQNGYATGHFGKWHLGGQRDVDEAPPISDYGFDQSLTNFEGMGPKLLPLTLKPGDIEPGRIWDDAIRLGGPVTWMQRSRITSGFVDAAIPFIDGSVSAGKPFFINLWPDDVHSPFWPPVDKWADGKRGLYLSVLREMDLQFGKLFEHVRSSSELRNNTIILICSDNGPELGAGSAGAFRGTKGSIYEGGIRSPLIVWAPGLMEEGKAGSHDVSSVLSAIDVAPSLLSICNVFPPSEVVFDGENLAPALLGKSPGKRVRPIIWRRPPDRKKFSNGSPEQPDLAIREGDWKLLCNYDGSDPVLYDLAVDREETKDLASRHPELVSQLAKKAIDWNQSMPPDNGPALGREAKKPKVPKKPKKMPQ